MIEGEAGRPAEGADDGGRGRRSVDICARRYVRAAAATPLRAGEMGPPPAASKAARSRPRNVALAIERLSARMDAEGRRRFSRQPPLAGGLASSTMSISSMSTPTRRRISARSPISAVAHSDVLSWWRGGSRRPAPPEWDAYSRRVIAGFTAAIRSSRQRRAVAAISNATTCAWRTSVIPNGGDRTRVTPRAPSAPWSWPPGGCGTPRRPDGSRGVAPSARLAGLSRRRVEHPESGAAELGRTRLVGGLTPPKWRGSSARLQFSSRRRATSRSAWPSSKPPPSGCALVLGDIPIIARELGRGGLFAPEDSRRCARRING